MRWKGTMQIMIASEIELCKRRQVFKTRDALTTRKQYCIETAKTSEKKRKKKSFPWWANQNEWLLTLGGGDGGVYIACLKATVYKFPSLREHTDGNVPLNPSLK